MPTSITARALSYSPIGTLFRWWPAWSVLDASMLPEIVVRQFRSRQYFCLRADFGRGSPTEKSGVANGQQAVPGASHSAPQD